MVNCWYNNLTSNEIEDLISQVKVMDEDRFL